MGTVSKPTWQQVTHGSNWENLSTGKKCIVQSTAGSRFDTVKVLHESGRLSRRRVHYFLQDYRPVAAHGDS